MRTVTREVVNPTPNGDTIIRITLPHVSIIDGPWVEEIKGPIHVEPARNGPHKTAWGSIADQSPIQEQDFSARCYEQDSRFIARMREVHPEHYTPKNVRARPFHLRLKRDTSLQELVRNELAKRAMARRRAAEKKALREFRRQAAEREAAQGKPALKRIKAATSRIGNIDIGTLVGNTRRGDIVYWRHIAMFIAHERYGKSYSEIARSFSDRNHTTVRSGVEKVRNQFDQYAADIARVEALL